MTHDELKAQILAVLDKPEAEQLISGAIALAEAELSRRLRVRKMVGRATATIDNGFEVLPDDFAGVRSFELASSSPCALEYVTPERLAALSGLHTATGAPVYYSVIGRELRFVPRPAAAYPNSMLTYFRAIPALGPSVESNWLLTDHPDAYLYGALKHLAKALGDVQTPDWAASFEQAVEAIKAADPAEDGRPR